jgi:hypothetical protein
MPALMISRLNKKSPNMIMAKASQKSAAQGRGDFSGFLEEDAGGFRTGPEELFTGTFFPVPLRTATV